MCFDSDDWFSEHAVEIAFLPLETKNLFHHLGSIIHRVKIIISGHHGTASAYCEYIQDGLTQNKRKLIAPNGYTFIKKYHYKIREE